MVWVKRGVVLDSFVIIRSFQERALFEGEWYLTLDYQEFRIQEYLISQNMFQTA
jgi:hypothetical protein